MERHLLDARWLERVLGLDSGAARAFATSGRRRLAIRHLVFTRWVLVMCHFERALYENPDRDDLGVLWWDLVERFQQVRRPSPESSRRRLGGQDPLRGPSGVLPELPDRRGVRGAARARGRARVRRRVPGQPRRRRVPARPHVPPGRDALVARAHRVALGAAARSFVLSRHAPRERPRGAVDAAPDRRHQRHPRPLRGGGRGAARPPGPRLPRILVLVAPPDPRHRRRRLSRGGDRRSRIRALVVPSRGRRLPHVEDGGRRRRPSARARRLERVPDRPRLGSAHRLELGSAAARSVLGRGRHQRAVRLARRDASARDHAQARGRARSSTSSTSSVRDAPRRRSSRTCGAGCSVSTGARRATRRGRCRTSPRSRPAPRCATASPIRTSLPRGSPTPTSTSTPASSSAPASPAGSTATATSTEIGRTSQPSPACRSRCRRSSSAAIATARRFGASRRSSDSRRRCPGCGARRSCRAADTGSSRSGPRRPTACWSSFYALSRAAQVSGARAATS